jgi:hypothetical protein
VKMRNSPATEGKISTADYGYESTTPTLDSWLEILKNGKFVIQGFIRITEF